MDKITMEEILQWLEAQRTEANARLVALGDGDESRAEHSPEGKAVRIINAIVERMGEMTAVEYLLTRQAMCDAGPCEECPFGIASEEKAGCRQLEEDHPFYSAKIVKKWKEEQGNAD